MDFKVEVEIEIRMSMRIKADSIVLLPVQLVWKDQGHKVDQT